MEKKRKLLIVDDSITYRTVLFQILREDYEVIGAENGKTALALLHQEHETISAVILDLVMPVMDGYEVLGEIQKDKKLSKIPVIVATQQEGETFEIKALALGAADFFKKPYKPTIIKHRLANIIKLRETAAMINTIERDCLTGVYNKEFFYSKVEERMGSHPNQTYDLICSDIEQFKLVNDLFGNAVGDQLLAYLGNILRKYIEKDGICGCLGGDVFAMLIPHGAFDQQEMFAQMIEQMKQYPIQLHLVIRFGIYTVDEDGLPVSIMCDRAKLAIASIKGKYGVYYASYDASIREKLLNEQKIIDCMKEALEEKQFQVYFQPKYDLMTERISGAEALVRWIHPEKGFMSPMEFIPLFEKNGFITRLDLYVWEVTCQTIRDWMDKGYETPAISVNVSRADIYNPDLPQIIMDMVHQYQLSPHQLHLEITESAYTEDPQQLIAVVSQLKELGFVIEMDDFGCGYSSLNMLSELPIDVLKLDRRFIQNESAKNMGKSILSFVISLAKWMNLLVIAEGVETLEQVQMLRNMDCGYAQGYYYSKPIPKEEFEALLCRCKIPEIKEKSVLQVHQGQASKGCRMLIIDNAPTQRTILAEIFRDQYMIVECEDGAQALSYIEAHCEEIGIILLNLMIPVMDGFQLLHHLKRNVETEGIPVIVISQGGRNREARALSMGAADFITKPCHPEVTIRRVENVVKKAKKELVAAVLEMKRRVERDVLTGLYHHAGLQQYVEDFLKKNPNEKATFIKLDVNDFKRINDTLGWVKGDEVLCGIAQILSGCFRQEDMLARMEEDEFMIFVVADLSLSDLECRMEKVFQKLAFILEGLALSCSIGMCQYPYFGIDYQELHQNAGNALLEAKRLGQNRYQIFGNNSTYAPKA